MRLTSRDIERFWSGVDRSGGTEACWPWKGANGRNIYRQFWVNGFNVPATHVAMALDGRPVREGFWALHTCDYKPCNNPRHLYEGTISQNTQDSYDRGRVPPRTKLTVEQVREIEELLETTMISLREIARRYGLSDHGTIRRIRDSTHQYSEKPSA